jgi:hypothetical protein
MVESLSRLKFIHDQLAGRQILDAFGKGGEVCG